MDFWGETTLSERVYLNVQRRVLHILSDTSTERLLGIEPELATTSASSTSYNTSLSDLLLPFKFFFTIICLIVSGLISCQLQTCFRPIKEVAVNEIFVQEMVSQLTFSSPQNPICPIKMPDIKGADWAMMLVTGVLVKFDNMSPGSRDWDVDDLKKQRRWADDYIDASVFRQ